MPTRALFSLLNIYFDKQLAAQVLYFDTLVKYEQPATEMPPRERRVKEVLIYCTLRRRNLLYIHAHTFSLSARVKFIIHRAQECNAYTIH